MVGVTVADTSYLVDLMRGDEGALRHLRAYQAEGWPMRTTIISLFELHRGLAMVDWPPRQMEKIRQVLDGMSILPLDAESAAIGGQMSGALTRQGQTIDPEDCLIAGIALRNGLGVVTRNGKHFERVTGLRVQSY